LQVKETITTTTFLAAAVAII